MSQHYFYHSYTNKTRWYYQSECTHRVNLEPTVITSGNREGLHGRIPGRAGKCINMVCSFSVSVCVCVSVLIALDAIILSALNYLRHRLYNRLLMILMIARDSDSLLPGLRSLLCCLSPLLLPHHGQHQHHLDDLCFH